MRLYWEIARRSFRRATTYRAAYLAGLITNAFFGALFSFVYLAVYGAAGATVAGYDVQDAVSYVWITQSLISVGAAWITQDLAGSIRTGDVVSDMARPWSFYGYWLSRALGERVFNLLVRGSLTYLIGVLYFGAQIPSLGQLLAFLATILLAILVAFAFNFIVNLTTFWLLDNTGVSVIANIMLSLFSGFLLPLDFFPPWLRLIAGALPFQAITSIPAQVFLGRIGGPEIGAALALQLFWAAALTGLAALVLRAAFRKVVIQGG
jgi:ABC-2 type transport system permease protein